MRILEHVIGWLLPAPVSAAAHSEPDNILAEIEAEEARAAASCNAQAVASESAQPSAPERSPVAPPRSYGPMVAHNGGSAERILWELKVERRGAEKCGIVAVYVRCPLCSAEHVHGWPLTTPETAWIICLAPCAQGTRCRIVGFHNPQRGHPGGPAASGPIARVA